MTAGKMNSNADIGRMATGVTRRAWQLTALGAVLHFLVDGLCACCLYLVAGALTATGLVGVFIAYNVLAFLTQPLTGMLADRVSQRRQLLASAVLLLSLAVSLASLGLTAAGSSRSVAPVGLLLAVASLLGVGNSLFHVWGGKVVAVATANDPRALGVFVSTGALGLAVGVLLHSWWLLFLLLLVLAVLSAGMVRGRMADAPKPVDASRGVPAGARGVAGRPMSPKWVWTALLLLMAFVMLRSFLGEQFSSGAAQATEASRLLPLLGVLSGTVAMVGKACGGWLLRGIGVVGALLVALGGALLFLWLQHASVQWAWLPGLLFINLTMAVTLWLANSVMPGREGLAFGLLAAALMPGYLMAQLAGGGLVLLPRLLATLVPTVLLELGVLWLLLERRAEVLWSSVVVNVLTNVPLSLLLLMTDGGWTALLVAEGVVVVVEMLWYRYFVGRLRTAFVYSFLCNSVSFLVGLLVQGTVLLFANSY